MALRGFEIFYKTKKIDYITKASNVKQHIMTSCTPDTGIS